MRMVRQQMKIPIWLAFAVVLSSCSLLNEDQEVSIDCEADPDATDCRGGQLLECNNAGEVVAVACDDMLTCRHITIGGADPKGICAPDCDNGSTSKVCVDDTLLLECRGNSIEVTDCGASQCMQMGMEAECQ